MATQNYYLLKDVEDILDQAKCIYLAGLISEGLLDKNVADEWCLVHKIYFEKESLWRTISNFFNKNNKKTGGAFLKLVKKVNCEIPCPEETEEEKE